MKFQNHNLAKAKQTKTTIKTKTKQQQQQKTFWWHEVIFFLDKIN